MKAIFGLVVFFVEKWLLIMPFSVVILLVCLFSRNKGIGFLFAFLLGAGGLVMGMAWGLGSPHIPYVSQILGWTIYSASTLPDLGFHIGGLPQVIAVTVIGAVMHGSVVVWTATAAHTTAFS